MIFVTVAWQAAAGWTIRGDMGLPGRNVFVITVYSIPDVLTCPPPKPLLAEVHLWQ